MKNSEHDTAVTTIIRQRPQPGAIETYEAWLKEIIPIARQFAGHQGVNVIRPHNASEAYTVVLHFDSTANLRGWLESEARQRLVARIRPHLLNDEDIDIKTGLEFWFTPPPGARHAKPYKQFLITLSVIFPLTMLIPWLLRPLFAWFPVLTTPGVQHLIIATLIVGAVTYIVMPYYTRLISRWLYS